MLPALNLDILPPDALMPPPFPTAGHPGVTPWRDARRRLGAVSHVVDGKCWLHVVGVASFLVNAADRQVWAVPATGATHDATRDEFERTVRPVALQLQGMEVLHAGAVRARDGVTAFCAPSETGKSTLVYALGRRGLAPWADDTVIVDPQGTPPRCLPQPFALRLRPRSAAHFRGPVDPDVGPAGARPGTDPAPLARICLLERREGLPAPVDVRTVGPAEAVEALLRHAIYFGFEDRDRKRRMMRNYLTLAATVPIVRLAYRSGLDALPAVIDAVIHTLALGPAS